MFYTVHPRCLNLISGQSTPRESHLCQPKTVIFDWFETCRKQNFGRRETRLQNVTQNLHYSLRMLRKNLSLTIAVMTTLALGIGATTAIYTVVYATLLAPMPYPNPDQLVMVWSKIQGFRNGVSAGDFLDWQQQSTSFQALKAFTGTSFNLAGKEAPEMVRGQQVTPGMYSMLGN